MAVQFYANMVNATLTITTSLGSQEISRDSCGNGLGSNLGEFYMQKKHEVIDILLVVLIERVSMTTAQGSHQTDSHTSDWSKFSESLEVNCAVNKNKI